MFKGEVIDLSYMSNLCDGDKQFMKEMIETFLRDTPIILEKMNTYTEHGERIPLGELAHKFKTSIMLMGIHSLHDVIREIERSKDNDSDTEVLPALVKKVNDTCNKALVELNDYINTI